MSVAIVEKALKNLTSVNERHNRVSESDRIMAYLAHMEKEVVCVPIIGQFSVGKSRAVNTIFENELLEEDLTPETAFPTEIQYPLNKESLDKIHIYYRAKDTDGEQLYKSLSLDQYTKKERDKLNAGDIDYIRLYTSNEFFESIQRIKLVDMPGFGSGNDIHDRAINDYISKSMAYIIAFSAESEGMVIHESLIGILKELVVFNTKICIMITKMDKAPHDEDFRNSWELLKTNLEKYIGIKKFDLIQISSHENDVQELKSYLLKLQDESEAILITHRFLPFYLRAADETLVFLKTLVEKGKLSESELKEEEDKIAVEIEKLSNTVADSTRKLKTDTAMCSLEIINDIQYALDNELGAFVSLAMNRDAHSVSEKINSTVRITLQNSFQSRFVSKAQRYVDTIDAEVAAVDAMISGIYVTGERSDPTFVDKVGNIAAGGVIAGGLSAGLTLGGLSAGGLGLASAAPFITIPFTVPILGLIAFLAGGIISLILSKVQAEKKREEARKQLRQQFQTSVFSAVLKQVRPTIDDTIRSALDSICTDVDRVLKERKDTLEKALADCRKMLNDEAEEKMRKMDSIAGDIQMIEEDRNRCKQMI